MRVQATDMMWGIPVGEVELNTHESDRCSGEYCVVHNPSDHHMREWPLLWRGDKGRMERECPHGVGHPDPDCLAHIRRLDEAYADEVAVIHGCDGCCDV